MCTPCVMVLYTNDAVEVRYSDGSQLQVSPCGTSILHHDKLQSGHHPVAGLRKIQQRCRFVTSEFRDKVLQALDFRNRFAERPYLCEELLKRDDIVALYADIQAVAWSKSIDQSRWEGLPDGGIRIFSGDEFASLSLSPHRRDFTVCYLSKISQEAVRRKESSKVTGRSSVHSRSLNDSSGSDGQGKEHVGLNAGQNPSDAIRNRHRQHGSADEPHNRSGSHSQNSSDSSSHDQSGSKSRILIGNQSHNQSGNQSPNQSGSPLNNKSGNESHDLSGNQSHQSANQLPNQSGNRLNNNSGSESRDLSGNQSQQSANQSQNHSGNRSQNQVENTMQNLSGNNSQNQSGTLLKNQSNNGSRNGNVNKPHSPSVQRRSPMDDEIQSLSRSQGQSADAETDRHEQARVDIEAGRPHRHTRVSTPTNIADVEDPEGDAPLRIFRQCTSSNENSPATHEISSISKISAEGLCTTLDVDVTLGHHELSLRHHELSLEHRSASPELFGQGSDQHLSGAGSAGLDMSALTSSPASGQCDGSEASPACQHLYTWVTRHVSCNECPVRWSHPLRLAEQRIQTEMKESGHPSDINVKMDKQGTVASHVPHPLPLTCPTQHQHKWAPLSSDQVDVDRFNSGRLKVIMVDGIIYRLIHLATLKVMEVYPGDGSVIISQGVSGQFFSHVSPTDGLLEERTYSIRALPPHLPSSKYPLDKVLKRASRLLCEALQRDKLTHSEDPPCWKMEPAAVVEPLSSTVLEEVYIPGSGRFTAHTNGRVRVAFEDRTFLDMVADFSKRLSECANHSEESKGQTPVSMVTALDNELDKEMCRLLLPSGKYIHVNKQKPGTYQNYVHQALEWASWVNSSPLERKQFYERLGKSTNVHGCAAAEIQKINCFNYILDNTVLHSSSATRMDDVYQRNGNHSNPDSHVGSDTSATTMSVSIHPPSVRTFRPVTNQTTPEHFAPPITGPFTSSYWQMAPQPIRGGHVGCGMVTSDGRTRDMLEGFTSVRHALLQTNKLIQDIDDMLDKKT